MQKIKVQMYLGIAFASSVQVYFQLVFDMGGKKV